MKVYWKTKTGQLIDIDQMDIYHLRNIVKLYVKKVEAYKAKLEEKSKFEIHGEIAQSMIDNAEDQEYDQDVSDQNYGL